MQSCTLGSQWKKRLNLNACTLRAIPMADYCIHPLPSFAKNADHLFPVFVFALIGRIKDEALMSGCDKLNIYI
jgi:hypothetical protein